MYRVYWNKCVFVFTSNTYMDIEAYLISAYVRLYKIKLKIHSVMSLRLSIVVTTCTVCFNIKST